MLLAWADRLFGVGESVPTAPRHWLLRYLAVTALLAAIIVARRPDAVTNPQFWAEDGYIFFAENLTLGFPRALAKLSSGHSATRIPMARPPGGGTSWAATPPSATAAGRARPGSRGGQEIVPQASGLRRR